MTEYRVRWSGRGVQYSEEEIQAVVDCMRNADPLTQGQRQMAFEETFGAHVGGRAAFAVSSGTAALHLAATLCRLMPGDEVILPAHTFAATAIPFARTGARLVWADIDPETFLIDPAHVARLITPRTRVVICVHLYGQTCDMDPLLEVAEDHGLIVVEDAAQALGATYKGHPAGSFGDFACFSFHGHKNLTTLGEGGMLVVRDPELAEFVPGLRHNGVRPFAGLRERYWVPAMSNVDFDWDGVWPNNYCIGEPQCALGVRSLAVLPARNAERRRRMESFRRALADLPEVSFQKISEHCVPSPYCLPFRYIPAEGAGGRDALIDRMTENHLVQVAVQYCPLYRYPMFQKMGFGSADCPETDRFFDSMVSLPFNDWMPKGDLDYVAEVVRESVGHLRRR